MTNLEALKKIAIKLTGLKETALQGFSTAETINFIAENIQQTNIESSVSAKAEEKSKYTPVSETTEQVKIKMAKKIN